MSLNRYRLTWHREFPQVGTFEVLARDPDHAFELGADLDERGMIDWKEDLEGITEYAHRRDKVELLETAAHIAEREARELFEKHPKLPGLGGPTP